MTQWRIRYMQRGGRPQGPSNPAFPNGVALDLHDKGKPSCTIKLPYPNPNTNIGTWICECSDCGLRVGITAASRRDDPHTAIVSCKRAKVLQ